MIDYNTYTGNLNPTVITEVDGLQFSCKHGEAEQGSLTAQKSSLPSEFTGKKIKIETL